ncbi:hypothetical protein TUM17577_39990 [Enterobacter asburiae]|nr:hypothetical protein TUM17577_39990 [Enterobacter asburiae]
MDEAEISQASNDPKIKKKISGSRTSRDKMIDKKSHLETFESNVIDAKVAEFYQCITEGV